MTTEQVSQFKPRTPVANIEDVSPQTAQQWLDSNTHNRRIRPAVYAKYARDMAAGHWAMTGEPIKFATDGTLLDGQHRLMAVVHSGVTVRMVVIYGLQTEAQNAMDSGAKRQVSDALRFSGYSNVLELAASAKIALQERQAQSKGLVHNRSAWGQFSHPEIQEFIAENPDLPVAVNSAMSYRGTIDAYASAIGYVWWKCARVSPEAAEEFFYALSNHMTTGPGDPRLALINRLAASRRNREKLSPTIQVSLFLRAWNAWREGRKLVKMQIESHGKLIQSPEPK